MAENSNIEWTDHTFNPWIGCTKVSPGCDNCYAAQQDKFRRWTPEGLGGPRKRTKTWGDPVKWNAQHADFFAAHGRRQRVFCASLADVFDNEVDPAWRAELFALIAGTPNLDWLLLTKRIGNVVGMVPVGWLSDPGWPAHVAIGATLTSQTEVDRDARKLARLPAPVRFISYEPALGPIDVRPYLGPQCNAGSVPHPNGGGVPCPLCDGTSRKACPGISWVIAGGESGPGARPSHPDWYRSLREQCAAAGVPFLHKQNGEWLHEEQGADMLGTERSPLFHWPQGGLSVRVGKKAAGRLLDGRTHDGFHGAA